MSRWFRCNLWLHRWASLLATPPFLVLCLTGTVLTFHDEVDRLLGQAPAPAQNLVPRPLADSFAAVMAKYPDQRVLSAGLDAERPGIGYFFVAPAADTGYERSRMIQADLGRAEILSDAERAKTFTGFLLMLHAQWFMGVAGEVLGSAIALLVLASLASGLVVYAPYMKRIAFGTLRRGRGARLRQLDLHNFIGAVVLGWALLVSATGALLGLGTLALMYWQGTELHGLRTRYAHSEPLDRRHPPLSLDQALAAAGRVAPGWRPAMVNFPGMDFSTPHHYTVLLYGHRGVQERLFRIALVDAASGAVAEVRELPWYLKAIVLSQPLHFGDYGGLPLKLLWTLCTWLTLFITANGAWLWWARRQRAKTAQKPGAMLPA